MRNTTSKNTISKTKKSKEVLPLKSDESKKLITEDDIRKRAFEIYQENVNSSSSEKDNWFYAERELSGFYN